MPALLPDSLAYWGVQPLNLFHHVWQAGDRMDASNTHHYALWFLRAGSVHVRSGEQHWTVKRGEVMLLPPLRQRALAVSEDTEWFSISLRLLYCGTRDAFQSAPLPAVWTPLPTDRAWLEASAVRLWETLGCPLWRPETPRHTPPLTQPSSPSAALVLESLALSLGLYCWGELSSRHSLTLTLSAPLQRALIHLASAPATSLEQLAAEAQLSPTELRRAFQKHLGTSPRQYLLQTRLEAACRLLQTTDRTVQDIAFTVGFESLHYFTRCFSKTYGTPPGQWRKSIAR